MKDNINKRIKTSNKIYPLFYGLSSDLIFFIAINTLFLTQVKELTSSEINFMTTMGVLISLFFYLFSHKIIKKIGNLNSIKLGTLLILIASILFTFSKHIILFIFAEILYEVSFVFKSVDTVVLNNNLTYEHREDEFVKIKSKATTIYSIATLITSLLAGFLFSINPYIPMIICIIICLNNFIMAHFIYEISKDKKIIQKTSNNKINFTKIVITIIIVYGLLYGTVAVCQTNDKLFMQYKLQEFMEVNNIALALSFILFLSRISRLFSNIFFIRIYDKLKNKIIYLINIALITSVLLFIIGHLLTNPKFGIILMSIGFLLLLALRDPTENVLSNLLLQNTLKDDKEQIMLYFQFSRRLVVFILSSLATLILTKFELIHLYIIIFIFAFIYLLIVIKLIHLLKKSNKS
ncbi:MAG: hypothetical protein OSJ70_07005 [Bacilli bacterium]|nr:hypothetical protein [Bacilli bacterium]